MSQQQGFIFTPGTWIGEGKISFNTSPEFIKFYTKWQMKEEPSGVITAIQIVEMQGVEEHMVNVLTLYDLTPNSFTVKLENHLVGSILGTGIIEPTVIAWEFRGPSAFEGFEVYELQENGDYSLHAEYTSPPEQFRTIIDGLIWKKS